MEQQPREECTENGDDEGMEPLDFIHLLLMDKQLGGTLLTDLMAQHRGGGPAAAAAAAGITNVPIVGQVDTLTAMGVEDPPTQAEEDAAQLIKRTQFYDDYKAT